MNKKFSFNNSGQNYKVGGTVLLKTMLTGFSSGKRVVTGTNVGVVC